MRGANKGAWTIALVVVASVLPNLHNNHKGGDGIQVDRKYSISRNIMCLEIGGNS